MKTAVLVGCGAMSDGWLKALAEVPELASFPYYGWQHAVVVPAGHPLEAVQPLTLEAIVAHPVITYHEGFTGRTRIDQTFARAGLTPDVVMSALDADVIKTYVELGLGVGILASMAFNPARDPGLRKLDSDHLFAENVASRCAAATTCAASPTASSSCAHPS